MLTVETTIKAPINTVWEYWIAPEHVINWYYASEDWYVPDTTNDLKVGGRFKISMAAKDDSMSFDFTGAYSKIILHQLINYTLDDGRKVNTTFYEENGVTVVTQIFEPETENAPELQKNGWQAILNNFKNYVED